MPQGGGGNKAGGQGGGRGAGQGGGMGSGRGGGQSGGRGMGGGRGLGQGGNCICPKCGAVVPHQSGTPCNAMQCASCGTTLTRQG